MTSMILPEYWTLLVSNAHLWQPGDNFAMRGRSAQTLWALHAHLLPEQTLYPPPPLS